VLVVVVGVVKVVVAGQRGEGRGEEEGETTLHRRCLPLPLLPLPLLPLLPS
jgi:hypothetical protein